MVTKPLKLLHVFPSFEVGGAQRRVVSLINADGKDCEHVIYAMNGCYDALSLIKGTSVAAPTSDRFPKQGMARSAIECRKRLKAISPDLMITYNWGSVEWVLGNRFMKLCPMIHVQDGFGSEEQAEEISRRRIIRSFAYKGCHAVVAPSRLLETLARTSWGISKSRLHYIPNGIDISRFQRKADAALLQQFGLKPDDRIIGTVAALRPEKNLGRLIEAFAKIADQYADTKLVIVGGGMGKSALQMLSERIGLGDRVVFTGPLSEPEAILPAFDIFALSSDTEQMPLSVIEAMAAGLPVASTDVGDIRAMVSEENRAAINGRGAQALAHTLSAMLGGMDLSGMGAANRKKAKAEYSLSTMVARYNKLFRDAV